MKYTVAVVFLVCTICISSACKKEQYKSSEKDILTFHVEGQIGNADINAEEATVDFIVADTVDLTGMAPQITVSEQAVVNPASGQIVDFSSYEVIYTVTAGDNSSREWTARVTTPGQGLSSEAEITSFTIPTFQVGETVIEGNEIYVEVIYGSDRSVLRPLLEISEGATVLPASGVETDFSSGVVEYVVTAEDGTEKTWIAHADYSAITPADDPGFQYMGRWNFTNPKQPRVWTPGAQVFARLNGSFCKIALVDENRYGSFYNYIEVLIDGTESLRFKMTGKNNTIDISQYLSPGEHTVLISKATESNMGYLDFKGLYLESEDALLTPDDLPERKMEFIGNSIVVGTGIDTRLSNDVCATGSNAWFDNNNAYYSYGALAARALSAQYHISGYGGIGLIHSCCEMEFTMPDVFGKYNLSPSGAADWDFSRYIPDVVVISLGQNDGVQDSAAFCSAYVEFIGTIRTAYANTEIVLLNSPLADNTLNTVLADYTSAVADYISDQGDSKVHAFEVSHNMSSGCQWHPGAEEHETIAEELIPYLRTLMGWP